jgi:hypothetical protein
LTTRADSFPRWCRRASRKPRNRFAEIDTDWPAELKEAAKLSREDFRKFAEARLRRQIDTALQYLRELRSARSPEGATGVQPRGTGGTIALSHLALLHPQERVFRQRAADTLAPELTIRPHAG